MRGNWGGGGGRENSSTCVVENQQPSFPYVMLAVKDGTCGQLHLCHSTI